MALATEGFELATSRTSILVISISAKDLIAKTFHQIIGDGSFITFRKIGDLETKIACQLQQQRHCNIAPVVFDQIEIAWRYAKRRRRDPPDSWLRWRRKRLILPPMRGVAALFAITGSLAKSCRYQFVRNFRSFTKLIKLICKLFTDLLGSIVELSCHLSRMSIIYRQGR